MAEIGSIGSVSLGVGGVGLVGAGDMSEGFSNPSVPSLMPDIIQKAFEKGGRLKVSELETLQYSLELTRSPYDPVSGRRDRRQDVDFDSGAYSENNQVASRHQVKEQLYHSAVFFYSKMARVYGARGGGGNGGASGGGFSYPRSNFSGCGGCDVDYSVM